MSPSAASLVCPLVRRLYSQSAALRLLFLAQSLGSGLALVALSFGLLQLCTRQHQMAMVQLPLGTLLTLANLFVALLVANIGALLSSLYHLHVPLLRPPQSHCYWLSFSLADCLMIRTILNVSLFATYSAGACLALERMAGSLLLIRRTDTRRTIAVFLAILQWLLSILAALPPALSRSSSSSAASAALSPHCALLTPSPTQLRPLFFAVLGMQAFVLAIYSILTYHNHFDTQVAREIARHNPLVLEQVHATEQSLPAAACVVLLFLVSSLLDRSFVLTLAGAFPWTANQQKTPKNGPEQVFRTAMWSELQTLAVPLVSLLLVAALQVQIRSQRVADEEIYERVGNGNLVVVSKDDEDDRLSDPYENGNGKSSGPGSPAAAGKAAIDCEGKGKRAKRKKKTRRMSEATTAREGEEERQGEAQA